MMRPFPQIATGGKGLAEQWTEYRKRMIEYAGIAIFVLETTGITTGTLFSRMV